MCRKFALLAFGIIVFASAQAQNFTVSGRVQDPESRAAVQGATVVLQSIRDSLNTSTTYTDTAGRFQFDQLYADSFRLIISSVGYETLRRSVKVDSADVALGAIGLPRTSKELTGVTVTVSIPPATQKGDTVQFNASQFKTNPDATVEDLARKIPGITIENGQVKAQGENVQKVTIDGRELFGDDATAALRNLPAEIVDKIQVFDRLSDQAQFTGFDDGSAQKSINIITKADMRNGQFGRLYAGYGTDNRYQAGGNTTFLKENRRISLVGNFNNINQQNFAQQDLLGVTSSGGRGGRGGGGPRGGGGGNWGGGSNNFTVGTQAGINRTNAFGVNFSDVWGQKMTVSGSYFFNHSNNNSNQISNRQYFLNTFPNVADTSLRTSDNYNHRINMRLEYRIDSANQIIITPNLSFQNNSSNSAVNTLSYTPNNVVSRTTNHVASETGGYNLGNNILWRHSFPKRGRTFSVNLNTSFNKRDGESITDYRETSARRDTVQQRLTDRFNDGYNLSTNLVYTEPIGQKSQLQLNYNPSISRSRSDQQAFVYDEDEKAYSIFESALSNRVTSNYNRQNAGLSFRRGDRDNTLSFGLNYQEARLMSDQVYPDPASVNQSFKNLLPNAMWRAKLSNRSNIRVFYRANTSEPSVTQLQNVIDATNPPFFTAGNPDLEQQTSHILSTRYNYTNAAKGILFVANVFLQKTDNYITNATYAPTKDSTISSKVVLTPGQQLSKPVNLDGYTSARSFLTFAIPMKFIKSNFNLNAGFNYSKQPGLLNEVQSESQNYTYTLGSVLASNISQYVDFTVSYSANFSQVRNPLQKNGNEEYFSHAAGLQMNLLSKNGWLFQNEVNNQMTSGLSEGFNQSYWLWNMSVGKKFLKNQKGDLRLSVFDLLKQNQSIIRNVTDAYIEDVQNVVLRQYFMLTFTYNLRNWGTAATRGGGGFNRPGGGPPRF